MAAILAPRDQPEIGGGKGPRAQLRSELGEERSQGFGAWREWPTVALDSILRLSGKISGSID
jgi:hypothetical protein